MGTTTALRLQVTGKDRVTIIRKQVTDDQVGGAEHNCLVVRSYVFSLRIEISLILIAQVDGVLLGSIVVGNPDGKMDQKDARDAEESFTGFLHVRHAPSLWVGMFSLSLLVLVLDEDTICIAV